MSGEVQTIQPQMSLLELALTKGADIDVIERLVALQRDDAKLKAEAEFNAAMNRVQSDLRQIAADADNPQTRSKYATYAALDKVLRPIYTREGFSLSYDTGDSPSPENLSLLCYVSHVAGHTRTYRILMPADGKGAKGGDVMTKTHATGSATSYGRRYLLNMIFNIAIGEHDDDGNGGAEDVKVQCAKLAKAASQKEVQAMFGEFYRQVKTKAAKQELTSARDARWKELE